MSLIVKLKLERRAGGERESQVGLPGGKAFQAKGTAGAKRQSEEVPGLSLQGGQCGWRRASDGRSTRRGDRGRGWWRTNRGGLSATVKTLAF